MYKFGKNQKKAKSLQKMHEISRHEVLNGNQYEKHVYVSAINIL